jgi:lipid A ethanolaminephosphotransferase
MYKYGVYIDADMVRNLFETTAREAFDFFILPAVLAFLLTGFLPALLVAFAKINYKPFWLEVKSRALFSLIIIFATLAVGAVSYKEHAGFWRNNHSVRGLINQNNYLYATFRYIESKTQKIRPFVRLDENAAYVPNGGANADMPKLIIFILGETARAKNFSLYGYERQTNPLLAKQNIAIFKDTTSCGTSTAFSVPCMFSYKNRAEFSVAEAKFAENLTDLALQAGYDVIWLENDDGCKGVCKRVYTEEMKQINNPEYCDGIYCKDEVLIYDLEERLKKINKNTFIILHTMGSHGPSYFKRYPDGFKKFTPTCDSADIQSCPRQNIINTYDNTILYTDYIISSVIDIAKNFTRLESGVFYVSDHGESLGEKNFYLHAFPFKIAPEEQVRVPMLLWLSDAAQKHNNIDFACLKKSAESGNFSHDNIFHSLLTLMNIETKVYKANEDFFAQCNNE